MRVVLITGAVALFLLAGFAFLGAGSSMPKSAMAINVEPASYDLNAYWDINKDSMSTSFEQELENCKFSNVKGPESKKVLVDTQIAKLALGLSEGKHTDIEKVNALFEYASSDIDYQIYESWRDSKEVLESKNGDCTDKSILLVSLLKSLGYDSYIVYSEENLEGSHAWVAVQIEGTWVQMDPTTGNLYDIYSCSGNLECDSSYYREIAGLFNEQVSLVCE